MSGILADEIGTRRERLAELDRRGADRLEGGGIVGGLGLDRAETRDAAEALDSRRRLRRGFDPAPSAMARQGATPLQQTDDKIGRAACRERVCQTVKISVAAATLQKK